MAASASFADRVVGAATQGAAGAVVAASLSSVTEPVVNRVLVNRMTLAEAVACLDIDAVQKFFHTTMATNFIKFPFFEVVNLLLSGVALSGSLRGAALGAVFTTLTLPITNYRYCKSVGIPVDFGALYKAYLPTVLRDIVYGICRNNVHSALAARYPHLTKTAGGRFMLMFLVVLASCLISAPGNEVRGYYLQPKDRRLPVKEFFKPERFARSTIVGALIMSTALGCGTLITGPATQKFSEFTSYLTANPLAKIILALFVLREWRAGKRHAELVEAVQKKGASFEDEKKK